MYDPGKEGSDELESCRSVSAFLSTAVADAPVSVGGNTLPVEASDAPSHLTHALPEPLDNAFISVR